MSAPVSNPGLLESGFPLSPDLHSSLLEHLPLPPLLFENEPQSVGDMDLNSASELLRVLDRQAELLNHSLQFIENRSRSRRSRGE